MMIVVTERACLAQCDSYAIEIFRGPNCPLVGPTGPVPQSISDFGQIVGYYPDCDQGDHAFRWSGGSVVTTLQFSMPLNTARAYAVNRQNEIIGTYSPIGSPQRGFRISQDVLANQPWYSSEALATNDLGDVVGYGSQCVSCFPQAFRWRLRTVEALSLPVGPSSRARHINNRGQIVGWMGEGFGLGFPAEAFVWQNGVATSLGVPQGGVSSEAVAINESGEIAGHFNVETAPGVFRRRGFHWKDGVFTDLGLWPGTDTVNVRGINDRGEIIGWCQQASIASVPFIWRDGVMTNLRTLLDLPPGFTLNFAWAINNQGQIAAGGRDYNTTPISAPGFRLTPVSKIPGDYDCDHVVDIDDLLGVIGHWGPTPGGGNAPADFNHDGAVNVADLLTVILHWTP